MEYVRLKTAIAAVEKKHGLEDLDLTSREMLNTIASANLTGIKIKVSDLRRENTFGALPTVLSRLKKLVEGGWIEKKKGEEHRGIVLLQITPMARNAFTRLSKALEEHRLQTEG